ncbi:hypothetical protein CI109_101490 [Kwoniella shandongensis]|uniref:Uncharacterized protein n=1 Tax=Kwoniella shandongensis TaxID=1734106 RepID=A0A5M6C3H2_9TREE|nr:uncharacterized protein CI109_001918 [Kwoniella shandongensis]KAA5529493.1 hypothetical protein CI109_001918 [Kwoniella shandongensis]
MGLQRTPPQRANQPGPSTNHAAETADQTTTSIGSPAKAFAPRNPGVLRTPPGGRGASTSPLPPTQPTPLPASSSTPITATALISKTIAEPLSEPEPVVTGPSPSAQGEGRESFGGPQHKSLIIDDRPIRPAPAAVFDITDPSIQHQEDVAMDVDEPEEQSVEAALSSGQNPPEVEMAEPGPQPEVSFTRPREVTPPPATSIATSSRTPAVSQVPPTTPAAPPAAPKTPRSRSRRQTNPLPDPPAPIPLDEPMEYGRRYQLTMETLDRAVKAGAQRWTVDHFNGCFPTISKQMPTAMENAWLQASLSMRQNILDNAQPLLSHYNVGPALQAIDEVDKEAREYAKSNPPREAGASSSRPDAWRPNVSPHALVAATVLPIYDEAYQKLREEYLELHKDCTDRYASILSKQATLKNLESSVSDGVVELDKTIKILEKLPTEDMMLWTESAETKLETRAPEQL